MFRGPLARLALRGSSAAVALGCAATAQAQTGQTEDRDREIVVVGGVATERGSAVTDIAPIATLDVNAITATGATTMPELLQAIRSQTQSGDGADPIFLLNGQRVSGYQEIGTLP